MESQPNNDPIKQQCAIAEEQCLSCDQPNHGDVHWVANVAIWSRNYAMARGKRRSWCTQSLKREACKRVEQQRQASDDENNADHAKPVEMSKGRLQFPARNPPGHNPSNRPRGDDRKNCGPTIAPAFLMHAKAEDISHTPRTPIGQNSRKSFFRGSDHTDRHSIKQECAGCRSHLGEVIKCALRSIPWAA